MTREEIYEHLAKVYLGKKKTNKKNNKLIKILLFVNLIAVVLLPSFYVIKNNDTNSLINKQEQSFTLALNYYPLRLIYNFQEDSPQVENLSLFFPNLNIEQYDSLVFSIRGPGTAPRILKISLENQKKEISTYYLDGIDYRWKKITIPLSEFNKITDWSNLTKLSFIIEAWNTDEPRGSVLIDEICFYSKGGI